MRHEGRDSGGIVWDLSAGACLCWSQFSEAAEYPSLNHSPLLEQVTGVADQLELPIAVGLFTGSPALATYLVATPLSDMFDVFADNTPGVEIEEARPAVFTTGNYLPIRDRLTEALLDAGLTLTALRYVGYEADTGYHHYALDVAVAKSWG